LQSLLEAPLPGQRFGYGLAESTGLGLMWSALAVLLASSLVSALSEGEGGSLHRLATRSIMASINRSSTASAVLALLRGLPTAKKYAVVAMLVISTVQGLGLISIAGGLLVQGPESFVRSAPAVLLCVMVGVVMQVLGMLYVLIPNNNSSGSGGGSLTHDGSSSMVSGSGGGGGVSAAGAAAAAPALPSAPQVINSNISNFSRGSNPSGGGGGGGLSTTTTTTNSAAAATLAALSDLVDPFSRSTSVGGASAATATTTTPATTQGTGQGASQGAAWAAMVQSTRSLLTQANVAAQDVLMG
ncbi:hypothetical protein Agub_g9831, partial [Astrephomene gubernaculifera]